MPLSTKVNGAIKELEDAFEEMDRSNLPDTMKPVKPIILDENTQQRYDSMEEVDENLSLEENEKKLIRRALKKHNGRRKEAALELGISERTLYRKIKEYEL